MIRAAIYCRLSDEDREKDYPGAESESIKNQKSLLSAYCTAQNWEIAGIFCDEDMSGADRGRPEFNRMLKLCESGKVDVVLCKTQSRFSRDMEVVEHYIHNRFLEWGVRFVGLLDHADTEDIANKKSRQINGLVNEWYLEDLSENIRKTLRHKKEQGIYTGSFAPYGYCVKAEEKGKLFPDPTAAAVVRRIYETYVSGAGYLKIARMLNDEGVPSPAEYKRLCGSKFKTHSGKPTSRTWTESMVRQILTNPVYCGTLVQGKTEKISYKSKKRRTVAKENRIVIEHAHAPIVEEALWQAVNDRIGGGSRVQKADGSRHIFAGRIYCGSCGSSMWKMSYRLKNGRYDYLRCKATKCAQHLCQNKESIRLDVVREIVEKEMKQLFSAYYSPARVKKPLVLSEKESGAESEDFIRTQILKQNFNIKQLYKDKLDGIIDNEVFYSIYQDIKENIAMLSRQLATEKPAKRTLEEQAEYISRFAKDFCIDAASVTHLIHKIEIGDSCGGARKITIFWNI